MSKVLLTLVVGGCSMALATPATADRFADAGRDRPGHASVYLLAKANSKLLRVPDRLVTGKLDFERSGLVNFSIAKVVARRFTFLGRNNSFELAGSLGKHIGREDTLEGDAAAVLRTGQLGILAGSSVNFAWGNGVSYAFQNPKAESGETGIRGVGTKKFQYFMSFETEFSDSTAPNIHLVLRLNHRSGVYGLISDQRTGSNYIGGGLRIDFR